MKVRVTVDEAWPEYTISDDDLDREVEVPDDFGEKYWRVLVQWREVQDVLRKAWRAAGPVVHAFPEDGLLTRCCGRRMRDLGQNALSTSISEDVTCKGTPKGGG